MSGEDAQSSGSDVVPVADPVLLAAQDQARAALEEITPAATIGQAAGHEVHDERTLTLFFECTLAGYPGWRWAAALTRVDEQSDVTVLEVELLPGPGAVVAPEWVPWSERLAQYRETQARQAEDDANEAADAASELDDDDDDELMDNDYNDFDDEIDGVDVDSLDADHDDSDDDDSDDDDSDDDDSDEDEDRTDESDETDLFNEDADDFEDDSEEE